MVLTQTAIEKVTPMSTVRTSYGIVVVHGASVNPFIEKFHPHTAHTANRIEKGVELVKSGDADILVTTGRGTALPMQDYAVRCGLSVDKVWVEPGTWSIIHELKTVRDVTLKKFLRYVGGKYPDDLELVLVHLPMQSWASDRLERNAYRFLRYGFQPYQLNSILPIVIGEPGVPIQYKIHIVEDGRDPEEIEHDKNLEYGFLGKRMVDAIAREAPFGIYFGHYYQIPLSLLSRVLGRR
ncbi:MAG: hypothetical protein QXD72_02125 [Candidatus Aenigmatarchaeota archaeon]